jgi:creatinine amidohydrolase
MPRRLWQEMAWTDFRDPDVGKWIALLQVASIEQHGPHLPVEVDTRINIGVVGRAMELLPADVPVTLLPMMPVGKSEEHYDYPGTLLLSAETITALWTEIAESVARSGVRKLVIVNSHGGQPQIMDIVARRMRVRHSMFVVACNYFALGKPPGMFSDSEMLHGIHGGEVETSIMMHLRPDLVRRDKLANFEPTSVAMAKEFEYLLPEGRVGFGWKTQDLHPSGACGDASRADAERGRLAVENYAQRLATLLGEVHRYDLRYMRATP